MLEQLERLLASPVFRSSKRLSGFLRYIVEETLSNGGCDLKERVIGVQVFGRAPDYDTSGEPVVRVSAGDLRKRIAQYYHEPGHENELRIDLPIGSYHPAFHLPASAATHVPVASAASLGVTAALPSKVEPLRRGANRPVRLFVAAGLAVALAGIAASMVIGAPGNAFEQFWGPVMDAKGPVLVYVGARQNDDRMVFEDALALTELGGTLRAWNRPYRILRPADLTPESLKQGPSLLIGGFTNPLARRLTQQLRFTFASDGDPGTVHTAYIEDRQNLPSRVWSVQVGTVPAAVDFTDYAIVSRVVDPVTDRIAVVSAGIRKYGTFEAAEFLSHPEQIEALSENAPRDWRKSNMQAVLAIAVRSGKPEPARVVASYFW